MNALVPLTFNNTTIRQRDEMISLTDLWRAAGATEAKRPANWARKEGAEFISYMAAALNVPEGHIQAQRGGSGAGRGATYAHWQIALAYAKYLSPEFHAGCNVVIRERMQGRPAPSLASDVLELIRRADGVGRANRHELAVVRAQLAELTGLLGDVGSMIDPAVSRAIEFKPAVAVLDELGVPSRGRRPLNGKVTAALFAYTALHSKPFRLEPYTRRRLFHVDTISEWLSGGGSVAIAEFSAARGVQQVLPFPKRGA
jgi:hypothetical protein